jgi:hypothetical protein
MPAASGGSGSGLSSTSTLADALAQLNDNLAFHGNATKAALYLEAADWLLVNRPKQSEAGSSSLDFESILPRMEKAERIIDAAAAVSSRPSFTRGRMLM